MQSNSALVPDSGGSQYTDEQRLRAVTEFSIIGSIQRTAESLNIPNRTLYDWSHQEWWADNLARIRIEHKDLIRSKLSGIIESGYNAIQDRIDNGDCYVSKTKQGDVIKRKPAALRDLGIVTGISFDKLRLLNNEPTSIRATDNEQLKALKAQFEQLANTKVIPGTVTKTVTED